MVDDVANSTGVSFYLNQAIIVEKLRCRANARACSSGATQFHIPADPPRLPNAADPRQTERMVAQSVAQTRGDADPARCATPGRLFLTWPVLVQLFRFRLWLRAIGPPSK